MKKIVNSFVFAFVLITLFFRCANAQSDLRIVIIRHGEKPQSGENLNCAGLNRAMKLPAVIAAKFGKPAYLFVPSLGMSQITTHSRMYQTAVPLAVKYNLSINTSYAVKDSKEMGKELEKLHGTVLVIWEHNSVMKLIKGLDVDTTNLDWPDSDYDSMWIVTYKNGKAQLQKDMENIRPGAGCPF